MNNLKIFSGTSNPTFSTEICGILGINLGEIFHHTFPSGEKYVQFKENIRGADVFLVQGITNPANDNLMELLIMADAARRASADRITAVIPYFGYCRQDRKDKSRTPISAKLVLDLIAAAGINRVLTMDLHSPQVGGFTNLPFDHLTFEPVLLNYIDSNFDKLDLIIMAPDVGALKRVERYANNLKCDFGFISKKRIGDEQVELQSLNGEVEGKDVIIIDDLTESAGTLIQAATACKHKGAKTVTCAVTHGCLTNVGMNRLMLAMGSQIDGFIYSNTAIPDWKNRVRPTQIQTLSVSELFARAIGNIHGNESVSGLFL